MASDRSGGKPDFGRRPHRTDPRMEIPAIRTRRMAPGHSPRNRAYGPAGKRADPRSVLRQQPERSAMDRQDRLGVLLHVRRTRIGVVRQRAARLRRSGLLCRHQAERRTASPHGQHVPHMEKRRQGIAEIPEQPPARRFSLPGHAGAQKHGGLRQPSHRQQRPRRIGRTGPQQGKRFHPQVGLPVRLGLGAALCHLRIVASGRARSVERSPRGGFPRAHPLDRAAKGADERIGRITDGCGRLLSHPDTVERQEHPHGRQDAGCRDAFNRRAVRDSLSAVVVSQRNGRALPLRRGAGAGKRGEGA